MSKPADITEKQQNALTSYVCLMRAAESVTARLQPLLDEYNLTVSQFGVLEALLHLGPLCQRDLAKKILKSSGNLTLVIDNLERNGLVVRIRNQQDKRYVSVELTEKGRDLIQGIFPKHALNVRKQMGALTDDELHSLRSLCKKLGLSKPTS